jgi:dihydropteroate synthase
MVPDQGVGLGLVNKFGPLKWKSYELPLQKRTLIMGVINITPDSFFDGGRYYDPERAIVRAKEMVEQGADIIDIGGESTRPGAEPVPEDIELSRVLPVIQRLVGEIETPISIDTYKSEVAARALREGAAMVNDISGFHFDPQMPQVVAEFQVPAVIMHTAGRPKTMQQEAYYQELINDIIDYLEEAVRLGLAAGINQEKLFIDPGIGFGKALADNLSILRELPRFKTLGKPIMVGASRKSFIGKVLGLPLEERLEASLAVAAISIFNGANVIRTHDVKETRRVAGMVDAILGRAEVGV